MFPENSVDLKTDTAYLRFLHSPSASQAARACGTGRWEGGVTQLRELQTREEQKERDATGCACCPNARPVRLRYAVLLLVCANGLEQSWVSAATLRQILDYIVELDDIGYLQAQLRMHLKEHQCVHHQCIYRTLRCISRSLSSRARHNVSGDCVT